MYISKECSMMLVTCLLVFTLKVCSCQRVGARESKLLFDLLQSDDISANNKMENYDNNRRLSPSEDLPIDDLQEDKSNIYDPRPGDINVNSLRQQLGTLFDKDSMSIRDPSSKIQKNQLIKIKNGRPKGRRPNYLSLLRTSYLQDGRKLTLNVSRKDRKKIQKFVWNFSYCPVKYSWKFLGNRFWPQWVKIGSCYSQRSCSIPPGMTCKPSASKNLTILRWHCANFAERNFCRWIHIQYPVITECSCSC